MNQQEKIEILAAKVMGWHLYIQEPEMNNAWLGDNNGLKDMATGRKQWNPFINISDAWMIAEKFEIYCLSGPPHYCILGNNSHDIKDAIGSTIQEAICEAALKTLE